MARVCLDLNVWCGALISQMLRREGTAAGLLTRWCLAAAAPRGQISLIVSWGMLERLGEVLQRDLSVPREEVAEYIAKIVEAAAPGPILTLGGVGVLPLVDLEDRHVLETAWAGQADLLVTANVRDFDRADADIRVPNRIARLTRAGRAMILAHPYAAAAWLDGRDVEGWPDDRG